MNDDFHQTKTLRQAVCAVIFNKEGHVLGISRPGKPADMNLPGGKVEASDASLEEACKREVREETGLEIDNLKMVVNLVCKGVGTPYMTAAFTATYTGTPETKDEGEVRWISVEELLVDTNSFSDYNKKLFETIENQK